MNISRSGIVCQSKLPFRVSKYVRCTTPFINNDNGGGLCLFIRSGSKAFILNDRWGLASDRTHSIDLWHDRVPWSIAYE